MVGYQDIEVSGEGFTLIAPTFEKIDGEVFTLADLKGNFIDAESVQFTDGDFNTDKEYFYFTVEGMGVEKDGWYDEDMNLADNVPVPNGASLMFASQGTTSIQFSGAVSKSKIKVTTVDTGFTAVGNSRPMNVKLSDIKFEGVADADSIQFIDSNGGTEKEYFYFTVSGMGVEADGWYDGDMNSVDKEEIPACSGVLFSAVNGTSVNISIPSAL